MSAIATTSRLAGRPLSAFLVHFISAASRLLNRATRAYRHRRDANILAGLDERTLADIGLTRSDVRDAFAAPLWQDPTSLLRARALERRLSRHGVSLGFDPAIASPPLAPPDSFVAPRSDRPARYTV